MQLKAKVQNVTTTTTGPFYRRARKDIVTLIYNGKMYVDETSRVGQHKIGDDVDIEVKITDLRGKPLSIRLVD